MPVTLMRLSCAGLLLALLSGCGQRGPLRLPDKKAHAPTAAAASPSAPSTSASGAPAASAPAASAPAAGTPAATTAEDKQKQDDAQH